MLTFPIKASKQPQIGSLMQKVNIIVWSQLKTDTSSTANCNRLITHWLQTINRKTTRKYTLCQNHLGTVFAKVLLPDRQSDE